MSNVLSADGLGIEPWTPPVHPIELHHAVANWRNSVSKGEPDITIIAAELMVANIVAKLPDNLNEVTDTDTEELGFSFAHSSNMSDCVFAADVAAGFGGQEQLDLFAMWDFNETHTNLIWQGEKLAWFIDPYNEKARVFGENRPEDFLKLQTLMRWLSKTGHGAYLRMSDEPGDEGDHPLNAIATAPELGSQVMPFNEQMGERLALILPSRRGIRALLAAKAMRAQFSQITDVQARELNKLVPPDAT